MKKSEAKKWLSVTANFLAFSIASLITGVGYSFLLCDASIILVVSAVGWIMFFAIFIPLYLIKTFRGFEDD